MVYYSSDYYQLVGFRRSPRKFKMYDGILESDDGQLIYVPFGDVRYQNFRDMTGLNLYPQLIHNDEKRRSNYRSRAKNHLREGFYSPSYFSYYYLW